MNQMITGVYKITSPSGKNYVGSAKDLINRERQYRNLNCKKQPKIYNSIRKYGWEAHTFEVIAITTPGERLKWEHILGMYYEVLGEKGMNCILPGYEDVPAQTSQETRDKISKSSLGKPKSEEHRLKTIKNLTYVPPKGKKMPREEWIKRGFNRTGKESWNKGGFQTDETKKKIQESVIVYYKSIGIDAKPRQTPQSFDARYRKVGKFTLDDILIQEYENIKSTEVEGFKSGNIVKCCKGLRKTCLGYKWKYLDNEDEK